MVLFHASFVPKKKKKINYTMTLNYMLGNSEGYLTVIYRGSYVLICFGKSVLHLSSCQNY